MEIAELLGQQERLDAYRDDYRAKQAAAEKLWNGEFYVSGENKQISWASQVWMTLGGATHGGADLLTRLENSAAEKMVTPWKTSIINVQTVGIPNGLSF